tara:strand:- start:39 stop:533 length:495 start_codon:yes stop_codon:yes gene_type:complete
MILTRTAKEFYKNILIVSVIFIIDRVSKLYVMNLSKLNSDIEIFSSSFLNIILIWNKGAAFGLFSFNEGDLYNIFSGFILLVIIIVLILVFKSKGIKRLSYLLVFGGAIGNFYDRIIYKAVPDFIDFHVGNFHWFVFNVADIFISIGVLCLILIELFYKNYEIE